ncbi:MAG: hypothetical protein EB078_07545 [Proteobacteria bacterium]|nr:hypothetical protein [Pseudomonadota bacterium]NDC24876.1 hypothetical protein [Pseudomonadota bacterium]NDD04744.1 hypothetical protein [Pseudomonadota bacterium]NDG27368.1 hypothetical protein [Pseudomonadota bacterium]
MKKITMTSLLFSLAIVAAERPEIPKAEVDISLTTGKSASEFFQGRLGNQECALKLSDLRKKHRDEKNKLVTMQKGQAKAVDLDSQERVVNQARDAVLTKLEECGECATRPIEHRTVYAPAGTQRWYIADGSCYLPALGLSQTQIRAVYDKAAARMLNNARYTKTDNGIPSILKFDRVDPANGKILPAGPVDDPSFYIFLSVRGPSFAGLTASFSYYIKNDIEKRAENGVEETIIRFNQAKLPEGFSYPDKIYDVTAGGKKTATFARNIPEVQGLWYLNTEGYFRYYTAADFGISLSLADSFARKTLLEALFAITDESLEEAK